MPKIKLTGLGIQNLKKTVNMASRGAFKNYNDSELFRPIFFNNQPKLLEGSFSDLCSEEYRHKLSKDFFKDNKDIKPEHYHIHPVFAPYGMCEVLSRASQKSLSIHEKETWIVDSNKNHFFLQANYIDKNSNSIFIDPTYKQYLSDSSIWLINQGQATIQDIEQYSEFSEKIISYPDVFVGSKDDLKKIFEDILPPFCKAYGLDKNQTEKITNDINKAYEFLELKIKIKNLLIENEEKTEQNFADIQKEFINPSVNKIRNVKFSNITKQSNSNFKE